MITVLIPAAGEGKRFKDAGYELPKPLLPVDGKPMLQRAIENVSPTGEHRVVTITMKRHKVIFPWKYPDGGLQLVELSKPTQGAVDTILTARKHITDDPLLIANCDQLVDIPIDDFLQKAADYDGMIMTFPATDKKWSFARVENGEVTEVAEKNPISDQATVGIYYFKSGTDFLKAANLMIAANKRVMGEFYVCPVYNELIAMGKHIGAYQIPAKAMHGLGTPDDYKRYTSRTV